MKDGPWPQICKIQLPLAGAGNCLIYNQDHSITLHTPVTTEITAFMAGSFKKFGEVIVDRYGHVTFGKEIKDPGW